MIVRLNKNMCRFLGLTVAIFLFSSELLAQSTSEEQYFRDSSQLFGNCVGDSIQIFHFVTHPPCFKGSFEKYVNSNLDLYGLQNCDEEILESRIDSILIKFAVTKNGDLCKFRFINNPRKIIKQSIITMFLKSPTWQPGTYDGGRMLNVYSQLLITIEYNRNTQKYNVGVKRIEDRILR